RMTELLRPRRGHKVLEVGTGSGYQAAILAEIVKPEGRVWSIERISALAEKAKENLARAGYLEYVTVIVGDGSKGYPEAAPYDRIIVTVACPEVPKPLLEQLKPEGRLVAPVGGSDLQVLMVVDKLSDGTVSSFYDIEVVFVPLIGEYGWKSENDFYKTERNTQFW
ncbi:MAG: protein-L-isoaspartate O-methyltransferase, partial [Acidilobaceae archaeon]